MTSIANKLGFYSSLYLDYYGLRAGRFHEPSDQTLAQSDVLKKSLRVHFWSPARTQGAVVTIYDMLPELEALQRELGLGWHISASENLPEDSCDWLICFKVVPEGSTKLRHRKIALLICDQAEVFWNSISDFDLQVATSSRPFASVVARVNSNTYFIGETEPVGNIECGTAALKFPPSKRGPILVWHGGAQSMEALNDLKPALERLAQGRSLELHIVSGQKKEWIENWGDLKVRFMPWSKDNLKATAAQARLGIIPARNGTRVSYLKPASRVRCLYALGVPTIGDSRVPDAVQLAAGFSGPLAHGSLEWTQCIDRLLNAPHDLDRVAHAGHRVVANSFSTRNTAVRWVRLLGNMA